RADAGAARRGCGLDRPAPVDRRAARGGRALARAPVHLPAAGAQAPGRRAAVRRGGTHGGRDRRARSGRADTVAAARTEALRATAAAGARAGLAVLDGGAG